MLNTNSYSTKTPATLSITTAGLSAKRLLTLLLVVGLGPIAASTASASGSSGGGFSGGGFSGSSSRQANAPKQVDEVYEFGKAVYLGRAPGTTKIKYCVNVDGKTKKIRGRTLRPYKGSEQLEFANALVNCEQPEQLALAGVEKEQVAYVLYYLNKRYKLDLDTNS